MMKKKRILVVRLDEAGKFTLFHKTGFGTLETGTALNNSMYCFLNILALTSLK